MFEPSSHAMDLVQIYPSGAEEWHCPTCGRRVIMQWPPKYKRIVLESGDEYVRHSGGKGGLQMGAAQIAPADDLAHEQPHPGYTRPADDATPDAGDTPDHESFGPWLKWLNDEDTDEAE